MYSPRAGPKSLSSSSSNSKVISNDLEKANFSGDSFTLVDFVVDLAIVAIARSSRSQWTKRTNTGRNDDGEDEETNEIESVTSPLRDFLLCYVKILKIFVGCGFLWEIIAVYFWFTQHKDNLFKTNEFWEFTSKYVYEDLNVPAAVSMKSVGYF